MPPFSWKPLNFVAAKFNLLFEVFCFCKKLLFLFSCHVYPLCIFSFVSALLFDGLIIAKAFQKCLHNTFENRIFFRNYQNIKKKSDFAKNIDKFNI